MPVLHRLKLTEHGKNILLGGVGPSLLISVARFAGTSPRTAWLTVSNNDKDFISSVSILLHLIAKTQADTGASPLPYRLSWSSRRRSIAAAESRCAAVALHRVISLLANHASNISDIPTEKGSIQLLSFPRQVLRRTWVDRLDLATAIQTSERSYIREGSLEEVDRVVSYVKQSGCVPCFCLRQRIGCEAGLRRHRIVRESL